MVRGTLTVQGHLVRSTHTGQEHTRTMGTYRAGAHAPPGEHSQPGAHSQPRAHTARGTLSEEYFPRVRGTSKYQGHTLVRAHPPVRDTLVRDTHTSQGHNPTSLS